jgi:hypothetical protein
VEVEEAEEAEEVVAVVEAEDVIVLVVGLVDKVVVDEPVGGDVSADLLLFFA